MQDPSILTTLMFFKQMFFFATTEKKIARKKKSLDLPRNIIFPRKFASKPFFHVPDPDSLLASKYIEHWTRLNVRTDSLTLLAPWLPLTIQVQEEANWVKGFLTGRFSPLDIKRATIRLQEELF